MSDFNTYQPSKSSGPTFVQLVIIILLASNLGVVIGLGLLAHSVWTGAEKKIEQVAELAKELPPMLDRIDKQMKQATKQIEDVKKSINVGFDKIPKLTQDTAKGWIDGIRDGLNNDPAKK